MKIWLENLKIFLVKFNNVVIMTINDIYGRDIMNLVSPFLIISNIKNKQRKRPVIWLIHDIDLLKTRFDALKNKQFKGANLWLKK